MRRIKVIQDGEEIPRDILTYMLSSEKSCVCVYYNIYIYIYLFIYSTLDIFTMISLGT